MPRTLNKAIQRILRRCGVNLSRISPYDPARVLTPEGFREYCRVEQNHTPEEKTTSVLGRPMKIFSGAVFCHMVDEIWCREAYCFHTDKQEPRILDCGANIGLSTLYFMREWPKARITAFEAHPTVFAALESNVRGFEGEDVELLNQAVWTEKTELRFATGSTSTTGRISSEDASSISVSAVRLADYLDEPIDFLKMDIEGAEVDVLLDCGDKLKQVNSLFVEYHSRVGEPQRLDELLALLKSVGFRLYMEKEGTISKQPLLSVREYGGFDLAINIYARR